MTFWVLLWKACLVGTLGIFALMAVLVTVGGARDIIKMLQKLKSSQNDTVDGNDTTR